MTRVNVPIEMNEDLYDKMQELCEELGLDMDTGGSSSSTHQAEPLLFCIPRAPRGGDYLAVKSLNAQRQF